MSQFAAAEARIRHLHARYADAVWRKDAAAFGDCFTEAAEWRIAGMVLIGRARIVAAIEDIFGDANRLLMTFQTPMLEVTGTASATGRTYVSEQCSWLDGRTNLTLGRYYGRFAEQDGRWRFDWRLYQVLYSEPADLSGTYYDEPDFGPPPGMPPLDCMPSSTRRG